MLCQMLYKAIRVAIACVVLLSMSPATAGAMPPMTGTSTAVKPTSRTAIIEAPRRLSTKESVRVVEP
jgi:hypothetical protein